MTGRIQQNREQNQAQQNTQKGSVQVKRQDAIKEWKRGYATACIEALKPFDTLLEIGFDDGFAAERIQALHPRQHTIIVDNAEDAVRAKAFASKYPGVALVHAGIDKAVEGLPRFDALFFHPHNPRSDLELLGYFFPQDVVEIADDINAVIEEVAAHIASSKSKYSNDEIYSFIKELSPEKKDELPSFLLMLKENGNITESQYKEVMKNTAFDQPAVSSKAAQKQVILDSKISFLKQCLQNYMHEGSRLVTFLSDQRSQYENAPFFEHIITDPYVEYTEELVSLPNTISPENERFGSALVSVAVKM